MGSGMTMARASDADIDAALQVCGALDAFEKGFFPAGLDPEEGDNELFDNGNAQHCSSALNHLLAITGETSLFRVCFGMSVLLHPRNKFVDPASDDLGHHPERAELLAALTRLESWGRIIAGDNVEYGGDHPLALARAAIAKATGSAS